MSATINNLEIINKGSQLRINVQTSVGNRITKILLWTLDEFRDYAKAINLSSHIVGTSNSQNITVSASSIGLSKFEDIVFVEITDNVLDTSNNLTPVVLGIVYNLSPYMGCMMEYLTEYNKNQCTTCNKETKQEPVILVNMLIDSTIKAIDIGYYTQAIKMVNKLKKICSVKECKGCETIVCSNCNNFTQN